MKTTAAKPAALAIMITTLLTGAAMAHGNKIAIGDGKISTSPRKGYVMSCQTRFNPNAPGARLAGGWIKGNYWYPDLKPTVDGAVSWSGGGAKVTPRTGAGQTTGWVLRGWLAENLAVQFLTAYAHQNEKTRW